eukprot:4071767-Prymnesium_polylepis.1
MALPPPRCPFRWPPRTVGCRPPLVHASQAEAEIQASMMVSIVLLSMQVRRGAGRGRVRAGEARGVASLRRRRRSTTPPACCPSRAPRRPTPTRTPTPRAATPPPGTSNGRAPRAASRVCPPRSAFAQYDSRALQRLVRAAAPRARRSAPCALQRP